MDLIQDSGSIGAAGSAAEAFLNSANAGEGTSQTPAVTSTPAADASTTPASAAITQTPSPTTDQPTPLQLEDHKTYLWPQADGTTAPMTGKDIKAGFLRQQDYTRKTQETAELRKQLEPYFNEREQVSNILSNENAYLQFVTQHKPELLPKLMQALAQHLGGQQQQPQFDPNGIATMGQAQTVAEQIAQQHLASVQQQIQQLQQELQRTAAGVKQELRDEQEVKGYNERINPVLKAVFEANPILADVPNAEESIRWEVLKMHKRGEIATVEQAEKAFRDVATNYATKLNARFTELQKQQIVTQQNLVTNGIEPPGGVLVQHQGGAYKAPQRSDGRVDFDAMGRDVEAFIKASMAG